MGKKGGNRGVRIKQVGPKGPKGMMNPMDALAIPPEEMIHLPPPPDRSYQIFWPIHETFSMDPSSFSVIYPSYLDSTKTVKQGRRISKEDAVPVPTVSDMSLALQQLGVRHVVQPYKGYPRDITTLWDNPGRVKVELLKTTDETTNKKALIRAMVERIPTLPSRMQRLEQAQKEAEELAAKEAEEARALQLKQQQQQQQRQAAANSKSSKKKSSKKRR